MFIKRKEWGAVSWKSMGHQGALRKETMAEEMSVFYTHNVSVNNTFHEFWGLEWTCYRFQSYSHHCLGRPYIITLRFSFTLEITTNNVPTSPGHLMRILDCFVYRQCEKPFGTFVVRRSIKRYSQVLLFNYLSLKERKYWRKIKNITTLHIYNYQK